MSNLNTNTSPTFFNDLFLEAFGDNSPFLSSKSKNITSLKSDYFIENDEITINVDVAGSTKEDVKLFFDQDNNSITIKIDKQYIKKETKPTFICRERTIYEQSRFFKLPSGVDPATISAEVTNGLLTIKAKTLQPKSSDNVLQIEIK